MQARLDKAVNVQSAPHNRGIRHYCHHVASDVTIQARRTGKSRNGGVKKEMEMIVGISTELDGVVGV